MAPPIFRIVEATQKLNQVLQWLEKLKRTGRRRGRRGRLALVLAHLLSGEGEKEK